MGRIKTKWESTQPNPDEKHLKVMLDSHVKGLEMAVADEERTNQSRRAHLSPLIEGTGLNNRDVNNWNKENREQSQNALKEAERKFINPPLDFTEIHEKDLKLAKTIGDQMKSPGNPHWQGFAWKPTYGGQWSNWDGESEEVPNATFSVNANRCDPRAQAWGEGWFDSDFSDIHAFLAFKIKPPSWGHLHVYTRPWVHGYYSLYSNDTWYNKEYAKARMATWVDVHQNFWRPREYQTRFNLQGDELNPERSGRIDRQYQENYYTNVGEGDEVTIRVGVQLYCRAKANGGRAKLNLQAGNANYFYVPYVYWSLHQ